MSAFDDDISNVGDGDRHGCRGGEGNNDDDEDDDAGKPPRVEGGKKGFTKYGFGKDIGKAKQVVLHQFSKAKKQLHNRRHKKALRSSSSVSGAAIVSRGSGKMIRGVSGAGCYFCFSRPQVVESPNESPSSDPNGPSFTYAMLKTLIEKNDFYSRECNPHIG